MSERLSLIAGTGAVVPAVIAAALDRGYHVQVLAVGRRVAGAGATVVPFDLGRPQGALDAIRAFGTTALAMAGAVRLTDRDREGLASFAGVSTQAMGDTGLSALHRVITDTTGARVVGVHEIAPDLLAPAGHIAGPTPSPELAAAASRAISLARQAGRVDLGQSLVVSGERAIVSEDIAGTDAMLWRVWFYRLRGMIGDGRSRLVLAKAAKPGQPHAIDLPAIGPTTIRRARWAGISLIAVQAGATLLIERSRLAAAAQRAGISVLGIVAADD